jgi:cell wall assembly regulator SMI1
MSIYQLLRARWLDAGIAVNEGVTQAALDRFEESRHASLPSGFKEYLLTINGMTEGQTDENLVSFLSLETIDQETNFKEISGNRRDMIFAEFSLYCHWYILRTSTSGDPAVVVVTNGDQEKQIATSFEDFVNQYLSSPVRVAHCWE